MRFHSIEIVKEDDGREVILLGTAYSPERLAELKEMWGEEVEIKKV